MTPCCMNCYFRYFSKYDAPCEDCVDTSNWEPEVTPDTRKVITDTEVKQEYRAVRSEILHKAEECVCGHRVEDYGTPEDNFRQIADL